MNEDGSIAISVDIELDKSNKQLAKLKGQIEKTEKEIQDSERRREEALGESSKWAGRLDEERKKLEELKRELQEVKAVAKDKSFGEGARAEAKIRVPELQEQIKDQSETVKTVQQAFNQAENAVDKYKAKIDQATQKLAEQKEEAGQLEMAIQSGADEAGEFADNIQEAGEQGKEATGKITNGFEKVEKRLIGLAKRVFIFSLFTSALRSMRDWMGKTIKTNSDASVALARLKGALLTLAQPLVNVVIPAFTAFVNVLTKIVQMVGNVVSKVFGTTYDASAKAAKGLYEEQEALSGVGSAAKEAGESLAGFDEINQLSGDSASGGGVGGSKAPDFSKMVSSGLDSVIGVITGLALMAIGAILTFSGANIPVGLALMVAGALVYYGAITADWDSTKKLLQGSLGSVMSIISGALLVIGAILCFSSANIPLGIALMAIGAVGLATVVAANWGKISNYLQGPIAEITAILSGALLVLGAILVFSGANIALGLGMMVVGALGLVATITANWKTIQTLLQGPIGETVALLSGALLVIGAILTFSNASMGLGLGLMALGAVGLATTIVANWDSVRTLMQGPIGSITSLLSGALLVLGGIFLFSHANVPLGLGLMVVGAMGLATSITANWDSIVSLLGGKTEAITAIVGGALLALGIILCLSGVAVPLGLGLLAAGGVALATAMAPKWDFILGKLKEAWADIKSWFNSTIAKWFTFDTWKSKGQNMADGLVKGFSSASKAASAGAAKIANSFSSGLGARTISGGVSYSAVPPIPIASVPHLARGAVIPPNREFMAVLGDQRRGNNIEAPEDLIRKIVREEVGANNEMLATLQQILTAIRAGHVIKVNEREFGRAVVQAADNITTSSGKFAFQF